MVTKCDEREAFEQFLRDKKFPVLPVWKDGRPFQNYALEVMFDAWQARAALASTEAAAGEPRGYNEGFNEGWNRGNAAGLRGIDPNNTPIYQVRSTRSGDRTWIDTAQVIYEEKRDQADWEARIVYTAAMTGMKD